MDNDNFISNAQSSIAKNQKLFRKFVNTKRLNSALPATMSYNNLPYLSGDEISNSCSQFF